MLVGIAHSSICAKGFQFRENYITGHTSAGYSLINNDTLNSITDGKLGFAIGGGYTWKLENHLFFSLTGEFNKLSSDVYSLPKFSPEGTREGTDSEGDIYHIKSTFRNFHEKNDVYYFNIHPSVGYRLRYRTYLIGGLKIGYNLKANSTSSTSLTNTAKFDKYIGEFGDLPELGLVTNKEISNTSSLKMGINMSATIEYGTEFRFDVKSNNFVRTGIFLDYGFLDIYKSKTKGGRVFSYNDDVTSLDLNPVVTDERYTSAKTNTIYTGVKLTYYYCTSKEWIRHSTYKKDKKKAKAKTKKSNKKMVRKSPSSFNSRHKSSARKKKTTFRSPRSFSLRRQSNKRR